MISELLLQAGEQPSFTDRLREALESAVADSFSIVEQVIVALVILILGYWIAGKARTAAVRLGRRIELDEKVAQTPLEPLFADKEGAATAAFAVLVRLYVLLIAVFAAFEHVGFTMLSRWLREAVTYVPIFLGGIVVLIIGFYVADHAARAAGRSETAQSTGIPHVFTDVTRAILYFAVVVIGLDTIGVSVGILYVLGETFAFAAGVAVALAVGIGFGWGAKDYVADNVADWHREISQD